MQLGDQKVSRRVANVLRGVMSYSEPIFLRRTRKQAGCSPLSESADSYCGLNQVVMETDMVCPILEQQLSYNYRAWLNELEWKRSICAKLLYARRLKRGCLTFVLSYPETIHL